VIRGLISGLGMSPLQLRVIALCIAINMLDGFDILAMAYTAPAIAGEWRLDPERLGLLFSLGLGGMMAGSILLAPLADRFGRRPLILACLIAATASMFAASFAASLPSLGAARVLTGLAIGGMLPCINTMVAEFAPSDKRALAVSVMQAGFAVGASLGGFLAVWLLATFGWPAVFATGAILSLILIPLVWAGMPESLAYLATRPDRAEERVLLLGKLTGMVDTASPVTQGDSDELGAWSVLAQVKVPLALVSLTFFSSVMSFYFLTSWVPKLLNDGGLSEGQAVTGGALLTAGGIIAAFALGWLSLKRSIVPIMVCAAAVAAFLTAGFGQLPPNAAYLLPAAFLLGLATNATQIGIYAVIPGLFPARIRASATGLAIGLGRIGSIVGPWLAGVLLASGWTAGGLFALMAVPYAIAIFLLLGVQRWQLH
jgi:benzoate transport